ncbi:MAG TPA: class I adenylate-forming enzyme family protein [Stellaceae bacterium]|nr:class I adenylate-forming enzyme family protein [Stellaceae bacterium]
MDPASVRPQDRFWEADGFGSALRLEQHFGGRVMRCFAERPANLAAMLEDLVRRFPARPAIIEDDRTITYIELDGIVATVAAALAAEGIAAGDRVALFLGNCWEFLATLFACHRLGAIAVPIGTRQRRAELEFLLNDCGTRVLVFEAKLADAVPPPESVGHPLRLFAVRGEVPGVRPFSALLKSASAPPQRPAIHEEDTAVILYTSGTTGRPKGARLTHLGIIHSAITFARCFGLGAADRGLVAVPLAHVTGLVAVSLTSMIVGGAVVLMYREYKTDLFLELASRARITFSILVPAIYTLAANHADLDRYELSAWRVGCFGGAPMPVTTIEILARKLPHLDLLNAYGATETTSPTTIMPRAAWRDHADSVGQVVPCGEVKVVDERGASVPPGTPGELMIAGPMVVPGYWQRPEANAGEFADGFWRSGDIGSIDAEGFVRVFDRRKDMINRGGFKIFSAEVEDVLMGLAGVAECAIVGRPDPVLGERVHAFVVPQEGAALAAAEVQQFCAARLADYKVPETVTVERAPLPRNANGKIQKAVLRERALAGA